MSGEIKCYICKEIITKQEMENGGVEMLSGPDRSKKIFTHTKHQGVLEDIKEEDRKETVVSSI